MDSQTRRYRNRSHFYQRSRRPFLNRLESRGRDHYQQRGARRPPRNMYSSLGRFRGGEGDHLLYEVRRGHQYGPAMSREIRTRQVGGPNYALITRESLAELEVLGPGLLVNRVNDQLKEFQQVIGEATNPATMADVVKVLLKLADLASKRDFEEQSNARKIIAEILSERSEKFHFQMKRAVQTCTLNKAEIFCNLFQLMLQTFESLAKYCLPIDELFETVRRLTNAGTTHSALFNKVEELCKTRDDIMRMECTVKPLQDDERDDSEFRSIPVLPEWKDIKEDNGIPPEVRPNKVDTPYKDWMEYYDIQFRLIREDFIAPLRRGVAAFLREERNGDVKIYSAAKIVAQVTTKDKGICFTVKFDASGFNRMNYNWNHSKRLIFGSLLCFIHLNDQDLEKSVLLGTIVERSIPKLKEGILTVQFEGDILRTDYHCAIGTQFEMIESNSYFEATSPILRSIQTAEVETMPFSRQILEGSCESILPPVYLRNKTCSYNLSCLRGPQRRRNESALEIEVLSNESWEAASGSELDSSQLNAIQTALTQEIAVIQGPPGTGKTYIGLKIVEGLLENRHIWNPHRSCPILVMCYTNHALDQFLEGIIDTKCCGRKLEVIRVGGRCKSKKVEEHNLSKIRRKYKRYHSPTIKQLEEEKLQCNPSMVWQCLKSYYDRNILLPLQILQRVAHPYHYYQLTQMAQHAKQQGREVEVWLDVWYFEGKVKDNFNAQCLPREEPHRGMFGERRITSSYLSDMAQNHMLEIQDITEDDGMDNDDFEGYQSVEGPGSFGMEDYYDHNHRPYYEEYESDDGNMTVKEKSKEDCDNIIKSKLFTDAMNDEEVEEISNIDLTYLDRWRLYNYWEDQWYKYQLEENRKKVKKYNEKCRELTEVRQREDRHILEAADVVGMTTTGAAKYQHILHHIKPKIVIVEEAAEVLEAHIVSALSAGTQHLILIGDHKQLRPKPNEHVLATEYKLSTSLFERLVMKHMSQATLEIQHRMRPEIARLVCPHVYETLLNHESVQKYPDIRGISNNLFFVCHTEPESENPNLLSYQNQFEAKYIVCLCAHLLKLGYSPSQITILTPYVGQLLLLRDKMPKEDFEGVRVTAIDNFQGEENDIILFSMVRSTNPNSGRTTIGFVKEDNRVCVSLSRAKHGFYAIGNFELIRHQSPLWESIISDVESRGCYGNALPLYCCNHPETKYSAVKESDFKAKAPKGGCKKMCDIRLRCGHSCTQMCHVVDTKHTKFMCEKPCGKQCPNNHPCESGHDCYEECIQCQEMVETIMPGCGHKQIMQCCEEQTLKKQEGTIAEGAFYQLPKAFGFAIVGVIPPKCKQPVLKTIPWCGHEQDVACSTSPSKVRCKAPCSIRCDNGHLCQYLCSEGRGQCQVEVEKVIPECNHKQMVPCFLLPRLAKCKAQCEKLCLNGIHKLRKYCYEGWPQCQEKVIKDLPLCGHNIEVECFKNPSTILCDKPCERSCEAGHKCLKLCHEECSPCPVQVKKTLFCGHTHLIPCPQAYNISFKCPTRCFKVNCERGHLCLKTCHYPLPCDPCDEIVPIQFPTCSHNQSLKCYMSLNPSKYGYTCNVCCEKKLQCSHMCKKKCGQTCQKVCTESVKVDLECGHQTKVECHRKTQRELMVINCKKNIKVKIACGHTIRTACWSQDYKIGLSKYCNKSCRRLLICGHVCQEKCSSPCTIECKCPVKKMLPCGHELTCECYKTHSVDQYVCKELCLKTLPCGHPCKNKCGGPCSTCPLKSTNQYPCGHSSKIPCSSTIEETPCKKKCNAVLSCGHKCSEKCGDCYSSRMHTVCLFNIKLRRYCGHSVTLPCAGLSDSCDHETHQVPCSHREDHSKCHEPCTWDCKHFQCERECGEECDRPPCNEPCDKELSCGHRCPGLCGERCMSVCLQCAPKKFLEQFHPKSKQGHLPRKQPFFELGCRHIFTVTYLDEYIQHSDVTIMPKQCPKCHQNIAVGSRYGNAVRRAQTDVINLNERELEQGDAVDETLSEASLKNCEQPLYYSAIKQIINPTKSSERNCLVQCFNSSMAIHVTLQAIEHPSISYISDEIMKLVCTFINCAVRKMREDESARVRLTVQLVSDFKSELYRLALSAQCLIAKSQYQPIEVPKRMRLMSECQDTVESIEKILHSLNTLTDKLSEEKYEHYFSQIKNVAPDTANIHVQTPQVPRNMKGMWIKCTAGHYFCAPHVCGTVPKPSSIRCPDCN